MVSLLKYGDKCNKSRMEFICKSTDEKPVGKFNGITIPNGSVIKEIDTGKTFMYDEGTESYMDVTSEPEFATPDWDENDETAPGYIKNRPFYDTFELVEVCPEQTVEASGVMLQYNEYPGSVNAYIVYFDGVEYQPKSWYEPVNEEIRIFHLGYDDDLFYIVGDRWTLYMNTPGTHTIAIYKKKRITGTIPNKYLPSDVVCVTPYSLYDNGILYYTGTDFSTRTCNYPIAHVFDYKEMPVFTKRDFYSFGYDDNYGDKIELGDFFEMVTTRPSETTLFEHHSPDYNIFPYTLVETPRNFTSGDTILFYAPRLRGGKNNTVIHQFITLDFDGNYTKTSVKALLEGDAIPIPQTASVGQVLLVKAVDEDGRPTEWETANIDFVIPSSTPDSTKKFRITVDDDGTISATEVTTEEGEEA